LIYKREYKGSTAIIMFNSASHETLVGNLQIGLTKGYKLMSLLTENFSKTLTLDEQGQLTVVLPKHSILVFIAEKAEQESPVIQKHSLILNKTINNWTLLRNTQITGSISKITSPLLLVTDGNVENATKIDVDSSGNWKTLLKVRDYGKSQYNFEIYAPELNLVTSKQQYTATITQATFNQLVKDPKGDDKGFNGKYLKPQSDGFNAQMDINQVLIKSAGGNLELSVTLEELNSDWLAPNGFDHLFLSIFIDLPHMKGLNTLPLMQSKTPNDFSWNYAHVLYPSSFKMQDLTPENYH